MCANPADFQSTILKRGDSYSLSIPVQDNTFLSNSSLKSSGVIKLEYKLKFDGHALKMYAQASRQINMLYQKGIPSFYSNMACPDL